MARTEQKEQVRAGVEEQERIWQSRWLSSAEAKAERLAHWQTVDQLYQGHHWQKSRASWRPDPVLNYTFHVVEEHRGQLAQIKAEPVFQPRRPTDEKKTAVLREAVKFGWQRARVPVVQDILNLQCLLKGTSLAHVYWDPNMSGGSPDPVSLMGTDGTPRLQAAGTMWVGDWCVRAVDPAHFFLDPGLAGPDLQDAGWCGVGELKLISALKARYGDRLNDVTGIQPDVLQQGYVRPTTSYTRAPEGDGYAYVFEAYEKLPADPAYKAKGYRANLRKLVFANWKLIDVQEYYYRHGLYPFVAQHDYVIPGQFWAMGEPQAFMALERLIRKIYEQVGLAIMLTATPQKILNPQAGITPTSVTSEIGKVYVPGPMWNPQNPLSNVLVPLQMQGMPQYVLEFANMLKQDIALTTGLFQGLPSGVTAASAVIAVFERLAARIKRKGEAAADCGRGIVEQAIGLIAENYTEQRVFRLTDPIDGVPWATIQGQDYTDIEYDIDMDMQATAPLSKAIVTEQATNAYKAGALTASEYLESIEFPKPEIIQKVKEREQRAEELQRLQAQGAMQPGMPGAGGGQAPGAGGIGPSGPGAGQELPPGIQLQGATPSAKSLVLNNLAAAGRQ